jgi:hypothetical protein
VKRLLILMMACTALALPAWASAESGLVYQAKMRTGVNTTSRAATGSCSTANALLGALIMRCSTDYGQAQAVYRFVLPTNFRGVPAVHASTTGAVRIRYTVTDNVVRVVATVSQQGTGKVLMVSVGYYVPG